MGKTSNQEDYARWDDSSDVVPPAQAKTGGSSLCRVCLALGAVLCLTLAIAGPLLIHKTVSDGVSANAIIDSPDAPGFAQFRNSCHVADNYLKFYFFNITNPKDVLNGSKPKLQEIGPFVYNYVQLRSDFQWHPDDTLTYRQHTVKSFNKQETFKQSNGQYSSANVKVLSLNLLFNALRAQVGNLYWEVASDMLWRSDFERLFSTLTVDQYINGYSVTLNIANISVPIHFPGLQPDLDVSEDPSYTKPTTIRVGKTDIHDTYQFIAWQAMSRLSVECPWGGNPLPGGGYCPGDFPCCRRFNASSKIVPVWGQQIEADEFDWDANRVWGRSGEQWPPGVTKDSELFLFNDQIWRVLKFVHNGDTPTVNGIHTYRFVPSEDMFYNQTQRPANRRYYNFAPSGLLANLSMVEQGADLSVSQPHFLGASAELSEMVHGLNPDKEKHSLVIDVEPQSGQTVRELARAQINCLMESTERWPLQTWFPKVLPGIIVPVAWFSDESTINDEGASELRQMYTAHAALLGTAIGGGIFFVLFAGCFMRKSRAD